MPHRNDLDGRWSPNLDVKQIFLNTAVHIGAGPVHLKAKDDLGPLVVGAGIGYRF